MARIQDIAGRLVEVVRPSEPRAVKAAHLAPALIAGGVLVASFILPLVPTSMHRFMPCWFLVLTGYPCAFCGMTRCFVALAHGHLEAAMRQAPLGVVLYAGTWAFFGWHAAGLISGRILRLGPALRPGRRGWAILAGLAAAAVLANWFYRLAAGLK